MNYCELLFYPEKLEQFINNSVSPLKTLYIELLTESVDYLKTEPELWCWDAMQWHFDNIEVLSACNIIANIDQQLTKIADFTVENTGKLINNRISEKLLKEYCTSDECAANCIKLCIDELTKETINSEALVIAAKLNQQMKSSDLLQYILDTGEDTAIANKKAAKKGNDIKQKQIATDPALKFSKKFAQTLWQQDEALNISAVSKLCLYALEKMYDNFVEKHCHKFIEFGAYEALGADDFENANDGYLGRAEKNSNFYRTTFVNHPDNEDIICVPCQLPKSGTLRNHINHLEPKSKKKRIDDYGDYESVVDRLIQCNDINCPCQK